MPFGTKDIQKGRKPFFTGTIQDMDRNQIYRISLWQTEEMESWFKKLVKNQLDDNDD